MLIFIKLPDYPHLPYHRIYVIVQCSVCSVQCTSRKRDIILVIQHKTLSIYRLDKNDYIGIANHWNQLCDKQHALQTHTQEKTSMASWLSMSPQIISIHSCDEDAKEVHCGFCGFPLHLFSRMKIHAEAISGNYTVMMSTDKIEFSSNKWTTYTHTHINIALYIDSSYIQNSGSRIPKQ